jgi:oligopeptide/dipeptide ABC transporter ATP-binding protein
VVEVLPRGATPIHPYTKALMASVLVPDPHLRHEIVRITGEIPSGYDEPLGCAFAGRCPHVQPRCRESLPILRPQTEQHAVACHVHESTVLAPEF